MDPKSSPKGQNIIQLNSGYPKAEQNESPQDFLLRLTKHADQLVAFEWDKMKTVAMPEDFAVSSLSSLGQSAPLTVKPTHPTDADAYQGPAENITSLPERSDPARPKKIKGK